MSELEKEGQKIAYTSIAYVIRKWERKREKRKNIGNKLVSVLNPWYPEHHMGQINSMVQGYPVFWSYFVLWTILQRLLEVKYNLSNLTYSFWTLPQQAPQTFWEYITIFAGRALCKSWWSPRKTGGLCFLPFFWKKGVVGQIPTMVFKTMDHDCLSLLKGQVQLCKRFIFLTYFYIQICYLHICSKETFKMAKHNVLLHKKKKWGVA